MTTQTTIPHQAADKTGERTALAQEKPTVMSAKHISGFKMVDNLPNPVDWDVVAEDGVTVGTIPRILVQPNVQAIRYFEISLTKPVSAGRTLIPVGLFREWPDKKQLTLRMASSAVLGTGPRLESDLVTAETEARFVKAFGAGASLPDGPDRYKHPVFQAASLSARSTTEHMS